MNLETTRSREKAPARARTRSGADVAKAIRERVAAGDLVGGHRLIEGELSTLLGAGRTAVRAALLQLAEEGVVELRPKCNARVRVVSADEAVALAELRLAIERLCVRRAAERISDAEASQLRALADELVARSVATDIDGFAEMTAAIRALFVRVAALPEAAETLARLRTRSLNYRVRPSYRIHRARTAAPTWVAIVDAICRRDGAAAEIALERHTRQVQEAMLTHGHDARFTVPGVGSIQD